MDHTCRLITANQTAKRCLTPQEARSTLLRCALMLSAVAICRFLTSLHAGAAYCVFVLSAMTHERFFLAAAHQSWSPCQPAVTYTERLQAGQGFGDWKLWKSVAGKTHCHWTHMCHQSSLQSKCCEESAGLVFSHRLLSCQQLCTYWCGMHDASNFLHQTWSHPQTEQLLDAQQFSLDCRLSI